jgi:hypothetical protein
MVFSARGWPLILSERFGVTSFDRYIFDAVLVALMDRRSRKIVTGSREPNEGPRTGRRGFREGLVDVRAPLEKPRETAENRRRS